jgi:hypothetical protein
MDPDIALVLGVIAIALAIWQIIATFSSGETPRAGFVLAVLAGCLIVYASVQKPGGYTAAEVPGAFVTVFGSLFN